LGYRQDVRTLAPLAIALLAAGCTPPKEPIPPKAPNTELIAGDYERRKSDGETAVHFDKDGSFAVAKNKGELDRTPHLGEGTYTIDKDTLTFTAIRGMCAESDGTKVGTYKVVLSKIGVRFTKVEDTCERRAKIDGQTWWRIR
jgi:hypothetical protein